LTVAKIISATVRFTAFSVAIILQAAMLLSSPLTIGFSWPGWYNWSSLSCISFIIAIDSITFAPGMLIYAFLGRNKIISLAIFFGIAVLWLPILLYSLLGISSAGFH
jgi:hypothetical protein